MTDYQSGGTMVMTAKEFKAAAYKQSYAGRKGNPAHPAPTPKPKQAKAISAPEPTPEPALEPAIEPAPEPEPAPAPAPLSPTKVWASASYKNQSAPAPLSPTKVWASTSSKNQSVQNDPAKFMAEAQKQAEAYKHMKPTEVRKALKADAERKKAEKERKEKARALELKAQLRIQKIKSEINEIKQKESQQMNINMNKQPNKWAVGQCKRKLEMELNDMKQLEELVNPDGDAGDAGDDGDDGDAGDAGDDKCVQLPKEVASFAAQLLDHGTGTCEDNSEQEPIAINIQINTVQEPHQDLTATKSRPGGMQRAPSRRGVTRTPSNLVPEMRRKASRRDLMFDHHNVDIIPSAKDLIKKLKGQEFKESIDSNSTPQDEKVSPCAPNDKLATIPASPVKKKQPSAEQSQTRKDLDDQREKLEQAKESFQKGYDLCWKYGDSPGALAEYRNALIVRESLLGKYHEDTGRSYYWIGRSLVKLEEFEEGLMAFTRALRIFERVLMKNHKFVKWVNTAIDNVFKEMDMEEAEEARDEYKKTMEASIASEREGDACRKKGQHAQAIAKYRDAIDNIEQYHPDAADLFCKIAIVLRSQGEFDRALEEYRYASEIYELSLGADHPETVKTLNNLIEKKRLNQISMALMEKLELRK
jgi:tetratricopeptide (TPR) repeat protein